MTPVPQEQPSRTSRPQQLLSSATNDALSPQPVASVIAFSHQVVVTAPSPSQPSESSPNQSLSPEPRAAAQLSAATSPYKVGDFWSCYLRVHHFNFSSLYPHVLPSAFQFTKNNFNSFRFDLHQQIESI